MTTPTSVPLTVVLILLGAASTAAIAEDDLADRSASTGAAWHMIPSLALGGEYFHYEEQPGAGRSAHTAVLPAARVGFDVASPSTHWFARGFVSVTGGNMGFDGSNQDGTVLFSSSAKGYMTNAEGVVGGRLSFYQEHFWLGACIGVGHRTWRRDLTPATGGYLEEYSWYYIPVTLVLEAGSQQGLSVRLDASAFVPRIGTLRAHFSDVSPTYSDLDIQVYNQIGGRLTLTARYPVTESIALTLMPSLESTAVQQGPGTPFLVNGQPASGPLGTITASEPYTYTTRWGLVAGAGYIF